MTTSINYACLHEVVKFVVKLYLANNDWEGWFFSFLQILRAANLESDAENSESPWALVRPPGKKSELRRNINSKYRIDELNEPSPRVPGIRALLPLPGGDLLTAGTDLKVRRWDHCRYSLWHHFAFFPNIFFFFFLRASFLILYLLMSAFVLAALTGPIVSVDHLLVALEMVISTRQNLALEYKLCRYFQIFLFSSFVMV